MEASVRTISALLTQGDPNILSSRTPSLEDRVVATLSAELAAALAQNAPVSHRLPELHYDDPSPDEEDELEDEQYSSGPENGPPAYRSRGGTRAHSPVEDRPSSLVVQGEKTLTGPGGEVQVMIVEGHDGETLPITLRARKGSEGMGVVSGVKRKR